MLRDTGADSPRRCVDPLLSVPVRMPTDLAGVPGMHAVAANDAAVRLQVRASKGKTDSRSLSNTLETVSARLSAPQQADGLPAPPHAAPPAHTRAARPTTAPSHLSVPAPRRHGHSSRPQTAGSHGHLVSAPAVVDGTAAQTRRRRNSGSAGVAVRARPPDAPVAGAAASHKWLWPWQVGGDTHPPSTESSEWTL